MPRSEDLSSKTGAARPRRACPDGALILHYRIRGVLTAPRPRRARPGGAVILRSGLQVFVQVLKAAIVANVALPGIRMPTTGGTSRSAVKNQRSTGTSPDGGERDRHGTNARHITDGKIRQKSHIFCATQAEPGTNALMPNA